MMKKTLKSLFSLLKNINSSSSSERMHEGSLSFFPPQKSVFKATEKNDIIKNKGLSSDQIELAFKICKAHENEVKAQIELLHEHRLSKAGWSLDYQVLYTDSFYAHAENKNESTYQICSSISIPIIFLSVAAELNYHLQTDSQNILKADFKGNSIENWFVYLDKDAKVNDDVLNWALDASLLLYFHEVSHVIFGHCSYKCKNDDEVRALELDADFNAGSMFGFLLEGFTAKGRKPSGVEDTSRRLRRASLLLGIVMKAVSDKSDKYHFPTTRTVMFNAGFVAALEHNGQTPKFRNEDEGNEYFGTRIVNDKSIIYSALKKSSLVYFAGTESGLEDDIRDMEMKTLTIRDKLKDGVLKKYKLKT